MLKRLVQTEMRFLSSVAASGSGGSSSSNSNNNNNHEQPRLSASMILLKKCDNGNVDDFSVLLMRRNPKMKFAASAFVFPGGGTDEADISGSRCLMDNLKYTAIRETFEECGILISSPTICAGEQNDHFRSLRNRVHADAACFEEILRDFKCEPAWSLVRPWCQFTTPTFEKKRFATTFFVSVVDELHGFGELDTQQESVSLQWIKPKDALKALAGGSMPMMPPQYYILMQLAALGNLAEVEKVAIAKEERRVVVDQMQPVLLSGITSDGAMTLLLPGDEQYPSNDKQEPKRGVQHRIYVESKTAYRLVDTREHSHHHIPYSRL